MKGKYIDFFHTNILEVLFKMVHSEPDPAVVVDCKTLVRIYIFTNIHVYVTNSLGVTGSLDLDCNINEIL